MSLGDNSFHCTGPTQFGAKLTYTGGKGEDTIDVSDAQIGETLDITLGPANNSVTLASVADDMEVGEKLLVSGGSGTIRSPERRRRLGPSAFGRGGSDVKLNLATAPTP
jgi:hypothetical protein